MQSISYNLKNDLGHPLLLKAIGGGSGSKKSCWAYLKELLKGEQRLFTELRYSIMFKSYRILKFTILAGSLIKKCGKFEFSGISGKLELVCQSLLNQAEIFTSPSLHQDKQSVVKELWNFKNCDFMQIMSKIAKNCQNVRFFRV